MLKVTYETSLSDFHAWGQARQTLEELDEADMLDAAEEYIEEIFNGEAIDETELNDYLSYEWEELYAAIGMPTDEEEEEYISGTFMERE